MEKFNGTLLRVLLAAIPLVGIGWILAVTDYFGIALTFQQVIAAVLGLACGAALLRHPYFEKAGIFEFFLAAVAFPRGSGWPIISKTGSSAAMNWASTNGDLPQ